MFFLVFFFTTIEATLTTPCTPCPNPNDSYDPQYNNDIVTLPGFGTTSCQQLQGTIGLVVTSAQRECEVVQRLVGQDCGCPLPANNCPGLCSNYNASVQIDNFLGFPNNTVSCGTVHSLLLSFDNNDECEHNQAFWWPQCGCDPSELNVELPENANIFGYENQEQNQNGNGTSPVQPASPYEPRPLCHDGTTRLSPEFISKDISYLLENFQTQEHNLDGAASLFFTQAAGGLSSGSSLTCGMMEQAAMGGLFPSSLWDVITFRGFLGICGCPSPPGSCKVCPTNDMKDEEIFPINDIINGRSSIDGKCEDAALSIGQFPASDKECWVVKSHAWACGCNGYTPWYLGADSEQEHAILAWVPRISGFLSLLGSLYIIQDVLRKRRQSNGTTQATGVSPTYQVILLTMSVFDISSSLAWMVSSLAVPEYDEDREVESGAYGARGNDATCKAQGFFLELGFVGSTACTVSLTTFYLMTIVYGYREFQIAPWQKYLVGIPSIIAVVLAAAAIPAYQPFYVACLVGNPNSDYNLDEGDWGQLIVFSILPLCISIFLSLLNLGMILRFVGVQSRRANKWRMNNTEHNHGGPRATSSSSSSTGTKTGWFTSLTRSIRTMGSWSMHSTNEPSALSSPEGSTSMSNSHDYSSQGMGNRRQSTMPRFSKAEVAVLWQAFFYTMAFLLTWVIYLIGQFKPYISTDDERLYAFWVTLLVLNPLMGFWNAIIYLKPWTWRKKFYTYRQSHVGRTSQDWRKQSAVGVHGSSEPPSVPLSTDSTLRNQDNGCGAEESTGNENEHTQEHIWCEEFEQEMPSIKEEINEDLK